MFTSEFESAWQVRLECELWDSEIAQQVGPLAFLVYLTLRRFVDAKNHAREVSWPSVVRLARTTGMSQPSVRKAIRVLESAGWIVIRRKTGHQNKYVSGESGARFVDRYLDLPDQGGKPNPDPTDQGTLIPQINPKENLPLIPQIKGVDLTDQPPRSHRSRGLISQIAEVPKRSTQKKYPKEIPNAHEQKTQHAARGKTRRIRKTKTPDAAPCSEETPTPLPPAPTNGRVVGWADPPPVRATRVRKVKDEETGRVVSTRELRHLKSARAKRDRPGKYSSDEMIAAWRNGYWKHFDVEDVDLNKRASWEKLAKVVDRRIIDWFEGDRGKMMSYLKQTLSWWSRQIEEKAKFPSGLPRLATLLEENKGQASFFLKQWQTERLRRDRG